MEINPTRPEGETFKAVGTNPPTVANPHLDASHTIQPVNMDASQTVRPANMEALPTELKQEIMKLIPDTYSLRALVLSSPSYHAAYLAQRKAILFSVLSRVLGRNALFDALIVHKVSIGPPGLLRQTEKVFLQARYYLPLKDYYTADDFAAVARHQHVMDGLAYEYKTCDVGVARGQAIDFPDRPLKDIYRSFYAVELFSQVFYKIPMTKTRNRGYIPYESELSEFIECENDVACVLSYIFERCIDAMRDGRGSFEHPSPMKDTGKHAYLTPPQMTILANN